MPSTTMRLACSGRNENAPRLFLHIGPPKTASTAFQQFMQSHAATFHYGGTSQPRDFHGAELSSRLHYACAYPATDPPGTVPLAIRVPTEISRLLESGRNLLVSEEMFLVDHFSTHQEKLTRLSLLLSDIPTTIILVVRDPVAGLSSLYQQLYANLPIAQQLQFTRFLRTNQARVFDYEHLSRLLRANGFDDVRCIGFDSLVSAGLMSTDIFGRHEGDAFRVALPTGNASKKIRGGTHRYFPPIRLGSIPIPWILSRALEWIYAHWPRSRSILSPLARVIIYPSRMRSPELPDAIASALRSKAEDALRRPSELMH